MTIASPAIAVDCYRKLLAQGFFDRPHTVRELLALSQTKQQPVLGGLFAGVLFTVVLLAMWSFLIPLAIRMRRTKPWWQ
jgi:hypothetical protein